MSVKPVVNTAEQSHEEVPMRSPNQQEQQTVTSDSGSMHDPDLEARRGRWAETPGPGVLAPGGNHETPPALRPDELGRADKKAG